MGTELKPEDLGSPNEGMPQPSSIVTDEKLERMLAKVRALLERAEHPNTPPAESSLCRDKAEAMMFRYRIDEAMLASKPDTQILVKWARIVVCNWRSEYRDFYYGIMESVIAHVGCRGVIKYKREEGADHPIYEAHFVGFPSDIRTVDLLFTSAQLAFQTRLEPKYRPELSDQENAYWMRKAGMEGWRIAMAIWGVREDKHLYAARRLFKQEALARGEDPSELLGQGNSMAVYRSSYANGFYSELRSRLARMRLSRSDEGGLVLAGRTEKINEAFWAEYPEYRPPAPLPPAEGDEEAEDEAEEGEPSVARSHTREAYSDPRENCPKCQRAKSGYCRDHSYLRPRAYREEAWSPAGDRAGRAAARSVDLGGSSSGRGRLES